MWKNLCYTIANFHWRNITDIGADYGYSASDYCSAFRLHHNMSPSEFRKECEEQRTNLIEIADRIQKVIRIEQRPDYTVMYERKIGNYNELKDDWCSFMERHNGEITKDTIFFERTYDDPYITKKDHCIYDICMTVEDSGQYDITSVLKGGRFVVYPFRGYIPEIMQIHQQLVGVWFPSQQYVLDERYSYDQYKMVRER